MLQLVLGASGSGKTTLLYDGIRRRAAAGEKSILLVPEQFTSSTESRIYHELGDADSGLVESFSFTSLAERILDVCGGAAVHTLTDAGRAVLVRRALAELADRLQYYARHRRSAAFSAMAAETIDELKSAGLSPDTLRAMAQNCGAEKDKLAELSLIYETYEALLAQTAMDPADRMTLAADRLEAALAQGSLPDFLAGRAVFIDEFDTFNAPKKRLMGALLTAAPEVTVALCADGTVCLPGDLSLFSGGRRVAADLRALARRCGAAVAQPVLLREDLRHRGAPDLAAAAQLLAEEAGGAAEDAAPLPPAQSIRLYAASSREEEARTAAACIVRLAHAGVRYREMAVVCRDPDAYRAAVRYEFRLAGIPLFCDEATTPAFSAPAGAVRALLALARGADYGENMVALAKTGLCALSERQVSALDNYVYTWSPKAHEWQQPFARSPKGFGETSRVTPEEEEDVRQADQARAFLTGPVEQLRRRAKGSAAAGLSRALYFCLEALGAEKCQQEQVEALRAAQGIPAAEEAAREWNVVMDLLNQMALLLADDALEPAEYAELFELLLRTSDLGHIPQSLDAVIFTSAGKMRLADPAHVFVLGLAEGEFPRAPEDSGLLTHADREALMAQQADLPDCFENRVVREEICFYKALTAPSQGLWLSWPEGLGLPLCAPAAALTQALAVPPPALDTLDYCATPAAALDRLGSVWTTAPQEAASLYAALQGVAGEDRRLAAVQGMAAGAPCHVTDTQAMERVLGKKLSVSPSQMEQYYSCRYSYFLKYVLGLRPREKAQLTPNQSGSLMHWVLQMALDPNQNEYSGWKPGPLETLDDAQTAALAARLTDEYVRLYMPEDSARFAYLIRRIKASMAGLLCYLRDEQRQGSFRPAACEQQIGPDTGCLPPQEYALPDGRSVRIIGTIDRADTWTDAQGQRWVRVVDYKTGSKRFDLAEVYCGLDCQMLLYLFTVVRDTSGRFADVRPAGVLYLLADQPPQEAPRGAEQPAPVMLDGLVRDDADVCAAMDAGQTGRFVPFSYLNGRPNPKQKKKLADAAKLERIETHLQKLVCGMAEGLYAGDIAAEPLIAARCPCDYCEYGGICRHEPGVGEKKLGALADPFGEPPAAAAESDEAQDAAESSAKDAGADKEADHA